MIPVSAKYSGQMLSYDDYLALIGDRGIDRVILSVMPGRCGSTYLARMIEKTGLCGTGSESLNERSDQLWSSEPATIREFLGGVLSYSARGRVAWIQIAPHRLIELSKVLSSEVLSSWSYSVILRRDILAQAVSYYYAVESGIWHADGSVGVVSLERDLSTEVPKVIEWVRRIEVAELQIRQCLRMYARDSVFVQSYEDIVCEPRLQVASFLSNFQVGFSSLDIDRIDVSALSRLSKQGDFDLYRQCVGAHPWIVGLIRSRQSFPHGVLLGQ